MDSVISAVTFMVSAILKSVSGWAGVIIEDPLLLFFVVFSFVGLGLGLIRRIIH